MNLSDKFPCCKAQYFKTFCLPHLRADKTEAPYPSIPRLGYTVLEGNPPTYPLPPPNFLQCLLGHVTCPTSASAPLPHILALHFWSSRKGELKCLRSLCDFQFLKWVPFSAGSFWHLHVLCCGPGLPQKVMAPSDRTLRGQRSGLAVLYVPIFMAFVEFILFCTYN